jgi:hypothetical protein
MPRTKAQAQGAFLDRGECLELLKFARKLRDDAKESQRYADKHGLEEDHCVDDYQTLVDKLAEGAGE